MKTLRIVLTVQLIALLYGCYSCFDEKAFVEQYFQEVYQPSLILSENKDFPKEYFPKPNDWREPSKDAFSPHSVLFVGYDSTFFYYYETHGMDFTLVGERGVKIDKKAAVEAISSFSSRYRLPWKYMMIIFEKNSTSISFSEIYERNGEVMIGRVLGPTSTGSFAITGLSKGVKKEGTKIFNSPPKEMFKRIIETLMEIRWDNATFLEQTFSENERVLEVSKHLHSSIDNYKSIILILEKENHTKNDVISICRLLDWSSETEQEAGEILLSASKK